MSFSLILIPAYFGHLAPWPGASLLSSFGGEAGRGGLLEGFILVAAHGHSYFAQRRTQRFGLRGA